MRKRGRAPLLIRGGTLVDDLGARVGDLLVNGQSIAAAASEIDTSDADVIDASGAIVVPGGIDAHTHFDLPVGEVRSSDDFPTGTLAAACGGTTCVIDFAGGGREPADEALARWHEKAGHGAYVDYGFHLTVTSLPEDPEAVIEYFRRLRSKGVSSVKLYLAYPDRLMVDDDTLGRALTASTRTGMLVCVHAEDGRAIERRTAEALEAGLREPSAIREIRPPETEAAAVARAASLAMASGARLYVVHLSSAAGLGAARDARRAGARVVLETCPQYLFLTGDRLEGPPDVAANFVCTPPLRQAADVDAIRRGLADSEIQVLATDHCPFSTGDRSHGTAGREGGWADFREIPGGLPGVETRLALGYQLVREGRLSLERWVEVTSGAPARIFGLPTKGGLAPGMDADIVVFDPDATRELRPGNLHMRTDHSPYADIRVTGWPAITIARGRIVARDGEPADASPTWGRFVRRGDD